MSPHRWFSSRAACGWVGAVFYVAAGRLSTKAFMAWRARRPVWEAATGIRRASWLCIRRELAAVLEQDIRKPPAGSI